MILVLADLKKSDVVSYLGSGDGRIVITAAMDFGSSSIGYEIDAVLVKQSRERARAAGVVDLASAYDKEKGAVAYLVTEFESSEARPAEVRLSCINANKAWLNGKEVMANEVYHSGSMLDQYIVQCELKQGTNRVLLKICQNEQTESWAQDWEFQFRLTDPTGKGLRSGQ